MTAPREPRLITGTCINASASHSIASLPPSIASHVTHTGMSHELILSLCWRQVRADTGRGYGGISFELRKGNTHNIRGVLGNNHQEILVEKGVFFDLNIRPKCPSTS